MRVDDNGQAEVVAGAPDWVVDRAAVRDSRRAGEEHARELVAFPDTPDLGGRGLGVLGRHHDEPAQPLLGFEPALEQPVVVGARETGREDAVGHDRERGRLVRREDPVGKLERLEDVGPYAVEGLSHKLRADRRRRAVEGVVPQPAGRVVPGVTRHPEPVGAAVDDELAGGRIQVRRQVEHRLIAHMDVAVDQHPAAHLSRSIII